MTGIATVAGSGAGLVIAGASFVLMRYLKHFPAISHPVLHRMVIIGMYAGGATLVLASAIGTWVVSAELWVAGMFGGVQPGTVGHAGAVIAGTFLAATVLVALIWLPDPGAAWLALALPFVLALSGGHLHKILAVFPGPALAQQVSHWLGG